MKTSHYYICSNNRIKTSSCVVSVQAAQWQFIAAWKSEAQIHYKYLIIYRNYFFKTEVKIILFMQNYFKKNVFKSIGFELFNVLITINDVLIELLSINLLSFTSSSTVKKFHYLQISATTPIFNSLCLVTFSSVSVGWHQRFPSLQSGQRVGFVVSSTRSRWELHLRSDD